MKIFTKDNCEISFGERASKNFFKRSREDFLKESFYEDFQRKLWRTFQRSFFFIFLKIVNNNLSEIFGRFYKKKDFQKKFLHNFFVNLLNSFKYFLRRCTIPLSKFAICHNSLQSKFSTRQNSPLQIIGNFDRLKTYKPAKIPSCKISLIKKYC